MNKLLIKCADFNSEKLSNADMVPQLGSDMLRFLKPSEWSVSFSANYLTVKASVEMDASSIIEKMKLLSVLHGNITFTVTMLSDGAMYWFNNKQQLKLH